VLGKKIGIVGKNKVLWLKWVSFGLILVYGMAMFYRLGTVPSLYVDESNYANEVISLAKFGTDIHGFHHPVYFGSVWGQGQSVLYATLVTPIVKLFGFSMTSFRSLMVMTTLAMLIGVYVIVRRISKNELVAFVVLAAFITSPWIWISGRWVLDANYGPLMFTIALLFMLAALQINNGKTLRWFFIVLSAVAIALTVYGYLASWIYLPVFLGILFFWNRRRANLSVVEIIVSGIIIMVLSVPAIYFAIQVNVFHITTAKTFLGLDIPPLPRNRAGSLINFKHNVLNHVVMNVVHGIEDYILGSDKLPWNSAAPFGVVFPWFLPFAIVGFSTKWRAVFEKQFLDVVSLFRIALVANLPIILIVKPNYNHWNFLNIPMMFFVGLGLARILMETNSRNVRLGFLSVLFVSFFVFLSFYFSPKSYFENQGVQYSEVKVIDKFMQLHPKSHLYALGLSYNASYWRLAEKPVDHERYLKLANNYPEFKAKKMGPQHQYGYLRDAMDFGEKGTKRDYILIPKNEYGSQKTIYSDEKNIVFSHEPYVIAKLK